MKRIDPVERLLGETPLPHVMEGAHRDYLRQRLLAGAQSAQIGRKEMPKLTLWKTAAAFALTLILISTGWTAEKIYHRYISQISMPQEEQMQEWELPDGQKLLTGPMTMTMTSAASNDPEAEATAKRRHEEMKRLILERKYEFVKSFDFRGQKEYVYRFALGDGSYMHMNFSMSLDNVASWEDYQQKRVQAEQRRQEQIKKAIADGRYRLFDTDVILIHICRDVETSNTYKVQRSMHPDPKHKKLRGATALYLPLNLNAGASLPSMPETSWEEHLDSVRDGRLELLDKQLIPTYEYEIALEDGSKTIFQYGGGNPLKKLDGMQ